MNFSSTAPGKLILLGEYAVLRGGDSLVMAVDRLAQVTVHPISGKWHRITSPTLKIEELPFSVEHNGEVQFARELSAQEADQLQLFRKVVQYMVREKGIFPLLPHHFHLNTDAFYCAGGTEKLGLGSSAALCVALVNALYVIARGEAPEKELLFQLARQAHHYAQGKSGSGIDIAAATYGGLIRYRLHLAHPTQPPEVESLSLPQSLYFTIIWTGKSTGTTGMVKRVQQWEQENPYRARELFQKMFRVAAEGIQAIKQNEVSRFLDFYRQYGLLLEQLGQESGTGIVSSRHKEIAQLVETSGGVYKPSGAGGGDVGLALCDSPRIQQKIQEKILHSSYKIINLDFLKHGAIVKKITD